MWMVVVVVMMMMRTMACCFAWQQYTVTRLTASVAFVGLKKPMFLKRRSSSVASDIILIYWNVWSLSLNCLLSTAIVLPLRYTLVLWKFRLLPGKWSNIERSEITFEPDTLFSTESSTLLNGAWTHKQLAIMPYSSTESGVMSVLRLAKAAPTVFLSSKSLCMWQVLFQSSCGLPICTCTFLSPQISSQVSCYSSSNSNSIIKDTVVKSRNLLLQWCCFWNSSPFFSLCPQCHTAQGSGQVPFSLLG